MLAMARPLCMGRSEVPALDDQRAFAPVTRNGRIHAEGALWVPTAASVPPMGKATPCCGPCSSALGPPDRADRGDRAQVLDQHPVDGEPALAQPVGQLVPEVPGSPRRGVARVPEEVDSPIPGEVLADGTERRLRLL